MPICSECKEEKDVNRVEFIDGECICHSCLYNDHEPFQIYPIGYVCNQKTRGKRFGIKGGKGGISEIRLFNSQKPFLYKLEDEKWITVVFYFHKQRQIQSTFHRGLDGKRVGVFASRTPERLSQIGISNVELEKVEDTILYVRNFDGVDGTPVLDIKLGQKAIW